MSPLDAMTVGYSVDPAPRTAAAFGEATAGWEDDI